ncbi:MAG: orotidine-5'-phosphate decarboxylase [Pirellulaceae bacterium]|nr:orotidine-5'-phosphate decarboxylase [Pirellulaceae bacterium]
MKNSFGDRLAAAVLDKRSTVCVGLDPRWNNLPEALRNGVQPHDLSAVAKVTERFCCEVIDAVATCVAVVKPQSAFFEQLGVAGMIALSEVVRYARQQQLLVIMDGKRGDIGSTAEGYADAYLGAASAWGCDALTVNPYLGDDTLQPFISTAHDRGAGLFVLVKTSNPGSGFIQDLTIDGQPLYRRVAQVVQRASAAELGSSGYGSVGAVVGATYPEQLSELRQAMPNAWLLVPGYGAQGGSADDVAAAFDPHGLGAIVNSSRGIIFAYQNTSPASADWQTAVAKAAQAMSQQLPRPS